MPRETLSYRDIARMIDISAVHTPHGEQEIRELVGYARQYSFGCVHVLPAWVAFTRILLEDTSDIQLGSPVGFPSGGNHTAIKRAEAIQAVADGVDELDVMINVGRLRSGDYQYVRDELSSIIGAVDVPVKVIIETHYLTNDEIIRACELIIGSGAQFIKTSTGWAETGATLENIRLIAGCTAGQIGVKASGGIRDLNTLMQMYRFGVQRFGINVGAAVDIIKARQRLADDSAEVTI
jgi:deoxyribose-phosphate aldolase